MTWAPTGSEGAGIGFDEHAAGAPIIEHLGGLGRHHIGFIGGHTDDNECACRCLGGFTRAIAWRGMTLCGAALVESEYGFFEGSEAMMQIVDCATPATAIDCGNDYLDAGALSALDRAGIPVPCTMSVASFNENDFAPCLQPLLTTMGPTIRAVGEHAGRYLSARRRGEVTAAPAVVPVQRAVRDSMGTRCNRPYARNTMRRRHEIS